ncbi:hypothetical protein [uncultured Megasphaera sp.]|uniref:hypothetical protein n=1 Tax=uncultured Megasphaera sp. TaxID=165188 RepID=UPI0026DDC272|nr:hypothetical protein [uncultured Megasphaera sp.]
MKRILLLLAVFITISAPIFASDWRYLTTSADGDQLYIDMDSISRYESYTDVWIKYISPSTIEKQLVRITPNKQMAVLAYANYNSDGTLYDLDTCSYEFIQ